ncbi:alkylation response protein AidB-like acyl-CoA dehydrogenase [Rhodococcus sp. 27YEA15]|uniref:acyl-CoA dehydrogenase family protein n=1 Tax=Rhodococcus sp. 27YEA15 TaxID=3156259 RepID=UPI003C7E6908
MTTESVLHVDIPLPIHQGTPRDLGDALHAVASISAAVTARVVDSDGPHPETFADLKRVGLPGFVVPTVYGGGGATLTEASAVIRALAAVDASAALVLTMHYIHSTRLLSPTDPPEPLVRLGRRLAADNQLLNFAASEGRSGAPSRGGAATTTARRDDAGGWILDGRKRYVTGSIGLDVILVTATSVDSETAESTTHTFVVDTADPGVRIEHTWDTIGLRGSASNDVVLDNVRVGAEAAVTAYDPNTNAETADTFYNWWSLLLASIHLGIGTAARSYALGFAAGARDDGKSGLRSEQPRTREHAAAVELALLQAETLLDSALRRSSAEGTTRPGLGPAVKLLVHRHATEAVDHAARLVGGASVWNDSPLSRYFRDLRVAMFNPPNDDVVTDRIAEVIFSPAAGTLLVGPNREASR